MKIVGVTVGTPQNPQSIQERIKEQMNPVLSINGAKPDENGDIKLASYNGEYEITPNTEVDVTLKTAKTFVDSNIKILKIPYAEVSNNSGGVTANIGG